MMTNSRIEISGIPQKVCKSNIQKSLEYFLSLKGITDPITTIHYIGGCSNHALKVSTLASNMIAKNWLVRLPGSSSELLICREAERVNTSIVAKLGICPSFESLFLQKGNVLQQEGYKVEEFLDNAKSLTHENFDKYRKQALAKLKIVHQCGETFLTQYNIIDRIKMMCYALQNVGGSEVTHLTYDQGKKNIKLSKILNDIQNIERLIEAFGPLPSVPCHNDIPPFNFMKIQNGFEFDIKIIDWEYSGMNDPMCDLAYIANENGIHKREAIRELLIDYYNDKKISDNDLQENLDRIVFYLPIIDLKVAVWSLIQVNICNQSQYIEDLREGWGPERIKNYFEKTTSHAYQDVIARLEDRLSHRLSSHSMFNYRMI